MTTCSTHVLDAATGQPAVALDITLGGPDGLPLASAATDADGRIGWDVDLQPGVHQIDVATGPWFAAAEQDTFYPSITITFTVEPGREHVHVALLLSPYSYTTYRGS